MLYEPAQQNYRTTSRLIGGHSAIVNGKPRLSHEAIHATRSIPQFTLKNSSGIGTAHSSDVLICAEKGAITKEMVKSHWNTKQLEHAKFDDPGVVTNAELSKSSTKPQNTPITPAMRAKLKQDGHAGVSTAFADPIQRQQHHVVIDTSVKLDGHYQTTHQRALPAHPDAARVKVQPSLTFKTHNTSRISDSYTSERVPITDTLASHFSIGHASEAHSSNAGTATPAVAASQHYQTTAAAFHNDPNHRVHPHRSAGTIATHPSDHDIVFHRARINTRISPFEHYAPDVSVRRYIPKSSQASYNIITGESKAMGSV